MTLAIFLGQVAVLLALNTLFVAGDFLEATDQLLPAHLSIELLALLAVAMLIPRARVGRLLWILASVAVVGLLLRLADIMTPWYFGRPFNAASDLGFLPLYLDILRGSLSTGMFLATVGGGVAVVLALIAALRGLLGVAWRIGAARAWRPAGLAAALAVAGWALAPPRYLEEPTRPLFDAPVGASVARAIQEAADIAGLAHDYRATIDAANANHPKAGDFPGLARHNLLLIYFESYGVSSFHDPAFFAAVEPARQAFASTVAAAGYAMASDFMIAPITGGGSWLAHATLESGVKIQTQPIHDVLRASDAATLGKLFQAAGYRTVAAMPHIATEWPESRFFGFDKLYAHGDFGYVGPLYSWDSLPDQFVLQRMAETELRSAKGPVFLRFVLSSSHTPFDRIPPVIDATALGDGAAYRDLPTDRHPIASGDIFANDPGYLAAVVYDFRVLGRFLAEAVRDDSLVIILGDHQPPLATARASHDLSIPIHVLSRDPKLLAPFLSAGYSPGVTPARATGDRGTETFLDFFIGAFGVGHG